MSRKEWFDFRVRANIPVQYEDMVEILREQGLKPADIMRQAIHALFERRVQQGLKVFK